MSKCTYKEMPTQARLHELFDYSDMFKDSPLEWKVWDDGTPTVDRLAPMGNTLKVDGVVYLHTSIIAQWHYGNVTVDMAFAPRNGKISDRRISNLIPVPLADFIRFNPQALEKRKRDNAMYDQQLAAYRERIRKAKARSPQKEPRRSSGQMTQGAAGTNSQETGSNEVNHNVAVTDNGLPTQARARPAQRQTQAAEGATGLRFCKRCAAHRKSSGGLFLTDALGRRYWICEPCTESYQSSRGVACAAGIESNGGRAQP
jgi:hypothetical protein